MVDGDEEAEEGAAPERAQERLSECGLWVLCELFVAQDEGREDVEAEVSREDPTEDGLEPVCEGDRARV